MKLLGLFVFNINATMQKMATLPPQDKFKKLNQRGLQHLVIFQWILNFVEKF